MRALDHSTWKRVGLACAATLWLFAESAGAVPLDQWGGEVTAVTASCPSYCTDTSHAPARGGLNESAAETSIADSRGSAHSSYLLDDTSGLDIPLLKAEAYSLSAGSGSAFASAFGVEGYVYNGPDATRSFELDIVLTGSVFDPTPGDRDTFISAEVFIFYDDPFEYYADLPTLIYEIGAEEITSTELRIEVSEIDAMRGDTLSFELAQGQQIYLVAELRAEAEREESYADAFSTLVLGFDDATGLQSASSVPEPGTGVLLGLGLLALGSIRRGRAKR